MGQASNSNRRASLDDKKERAAGRQKTPGYHQGNRDDFDEPSIGRGQTKGAFGQSGQGLTDLPPDNLSEGGGESAPQDMDTPSASEPTKERDA